MACGNRLPLAIQPANCGVPRRGVQVAQQQAKQGCFAGTIGSEQSKHLTRFDTERTSIESRKPAVSFRERVRFDKQSIRLRNSPAWYRLLAILVV